MKIFVIAVLIIVGIYWLIGHTAPFPFNHEQFGLYQHNIHRTIGIIILTVAGIIWWKWKKK